MVMETNWIFDIDDAAPSKLSLCNKFNTSHSSYSTRNVTVKTVHRLDLRIWLSVLQKRDFYLVISSFHICPNWYWSSLS